MRILLTGRTGQVGSALAPLLAPLGTVAAPPRGEADLARPETLRAAVRAAQPDVIVNAAAYTAVDRAEADRAPCFAVNAEGVEVLAAQARARGALLVHFSTDYVFDGEKPSPYVESDATAPLNVYGESKLAGERAVAASGCRHLVFRTSWVYGPGGRNFVRAILDAARRGGELRVVDDQRGAPTSSLQIAKAVARVLARPRAGEEASGLFHLSAAGETTWHGFAAEILEAARAPASLRAVTTAEYGARARRPRNSLLDNARFRGAFGFALEDWREAYRAAAGAFAAAGA